MPLKIPLGSGRARVQTRSDTQTHEWPERLHRSFTLEERSRAVRARTQLSLSLSRGVSCSEVPAQVPVPNWLSTRSSSSRSDPSSTWQTDTSSANTATGSIKGPKGGGGVKVEKNKQAAATRVARFVLRGIGGLAFGDRARGSVQPQHRFRILRSVFESGWDWCLGEDTMESVLESRVTVASTFGTLDIPSRILETYRSYESRTKCKSILWLRAGARCETSDGPPTPRTAFARTSVERERERESPRALRRRRSENLWTPRDSSVDARL